MMALIGTFTYEFEVSLPLFARGPLEGGATTYSWLMGAFGLGAVLGGIYCTRHAQTGVPRMIRAAGMYMAAMLATACTDSLSTAVILLVLVGFASITFLTPESGVWVYPLPAPDVIVPLVLFDPFVIREYLMKSMTNQSTHRRAS